MPLWGDELVATVRRYRYFTGLLTMVNDENRGTAWVDEDGVDRFSLLRERGTDARGVAAYVCLRAGSLGRGG